MKVVTTFGSSEQQSSMATAKILGKRTHQVPGKLCKFWRSSGYLDHPLGRLNVSEIFFEVPRDYSNPSKGSLKLFARSVERFEKPVDLSKKEVNQPPWCMQNLTMSKLYSLNFSLSISPLSTRR